MGTFLKIIFFPALFSTLSANLWAAASQVDFNNLVRATVHPIYLEKPIPTRAYGTLRDDQGYLWIASENNLLRYDGYTIKEFPIIQGKAASLDRRVRVLHLAEDGSIWIGSTSLIHFHPNTETFEEYDVYGPDYLIDDIETDKNGILWVGGQGANLIGFDPQKNQIIHNIPISDSQYPQAHTITSIARSLSKTKLWLATGSGVLQFNTETLAFESYPVPQSLQLGNRLLRDIAVDNQDIVWVATSEGLLSIDPTTKVFQQFTHDPFNPNGLATNDLWSVFQDSKGNIWIGTDKKGVHVIPNQGKEFLHIPSSINGSTQFPMSSIVDIYEDHFGSIWFSAGYYGVRRISNEIDKFFIIRHSVDNPNSLSFDHTRAIIQDAKDNIWIATDGGGLNYYNPKANQFTHYTNNPADPHSLSSDSVISLAEDSTGAIWIGTWAGGLNKFDPLTKKFTRIQKDSSKAYGDGLLGNNIFMTYVDNLDRVWLNVLGEGLQIYNPKDESFITFAATKSSDATTTINTSIYKIIPNQDGTYWIGGKFGLELLDLEKKHFTRIINDQIQSVYDILKEGNDSLWLATSNGLILYHPTTNQTETYSVDNGLIHNNVTGIEKDPQGFLWLGTRGGLSRFNPKDQSFINFDNDDGLPGTQFNQYSHLTTKAGVMYFGCVNGIGVFDPNRIPVNNNTPNIALTRIEVYDESGTSITISNSQISNGLILPYDNRNIAFEFSSLSFISPASNLYKYKLEGLDKGWITTDSRHRNVRYTNLAPGQYQFRVIGSNNDNVWNLDGVSVQLAIQPPWWQTWWARSVYILVVGLSIYLFMAWKFRFNNLRNKTLELLVEEKTTNLDLNRKLNERTINILERERKLIAHEVHDNINSTIIATRLITQSIERLCNDPKPNTQRIHHLAKKADQQLAETYDFFRDMVRQIRPETIETLGFSQAISALVENYKEIHSKCEFELHRSGDELAIEEEVGIGLFRIGQEAITNAIKHAAASKIIVDVVYQKDKMEFAVIDNGIGLPEKLHQGLGMTHMLERAISMDALLTVEKLNGQPFNTGTRVLVKVPVPQKPKHT